MIQYDYTVEIWNVDPKKPTGPMWFTDKSDGSQWEIVSLAYSPSRWPFARGKWLVLCRRERKGPAVAYADELTKGRE